jgi:tight adherence protein B
MPVKYLGLLALGFSIFGLSYHYNKRFVDWLRFQSLGTRDYIVERLSIMFIDIPQQRILLGLFLISFGFGTLIFLLFLPQLFPAILFGTLATVVGWKAPKPVVDWLYRRRVAKFTLQMIDALGLMSNGLKSGLSIVTMVLSQNQLGVSLEDAFLNLSKRVVSDDVEMFVTSVNILKETGGNLAETFDTIVTTIRDRIKVQNKIAALTAQGMNQGFVVMMIPPILGFTFYQTDPDFMRPLFATPVGWAILLAIVILEAVGFFVIMRIVKIDV